jgi:protein TonB
MTRYSSSSSPRAASVGRRGFVNTIVGTRATPIHVFTKNERIVIQPSSAAARALLLTASIAAHAGVFLAAPRPALRFAFADPAADVEIDEAPPDPPAADTASAGSMGRATTAEAPEQASRPGGVRARGSARAQGACVTSATETTRSPATIANVGVPSFTMALGSPAGDASGTARPVDAAGDDADAVPEEGVSTPARLARGGAPLYPQLAREKGVEADVPLEIVISPSGAVESARALSHPGYGLEQAALQGVRSYRFSPAIQGDRPVRVRMRWTVEFRLW